MSTGEWAAIGFIGSIVVVSSAGLLGAIYRIFSVLTKLDSSLNLVIQSLHILKSSLDNLSLEHSKIIQELIRIQSKDA